MALDRDAIITDIERSFGSRLVLTPREHSPVAASSSSDVLVLGVDFVDPKHLCSGACFYKLIETGLVGSPRSLP